jgi:hypothetical protein
MKRRTVIRGVLAASGMGIFPAAAVQAQTATTSNPKSPAVQYEVLSPWAEVNPIPLRGVSPRIPTLAGKKIGIFVNFKRAAPPIADSIEKRLKTMYPDIQITRWRSPLPNVNEIETKNKDNFVAWAKGVDAAIAVVGD